MFYTIYKITNTINSKYYIGKHQTDNLNDDYFGSGKLLKRATEKYGKHNFKKEILHVFDDEEEMNKKEKELVIISEQTYNLCEGGNGGFSYINSYVYTKEKRQKHNAKTAPLAAKARNDYIRERRKADPIWAQEYNKKLSKSIKKYFENGGMPGFKNKKHTEEWKKEQSIRMSEKQKGQRNSQYGTFWITNGIEVKKIKKEELDFWIELGYNRGRKKFL